MRLRELRGPLLFTFGLALAFELGLRAVAGIGWITLVPGDIHGFDRLNRGDDVPLQERLYEPSRNLIFRLRPHFKTTYSRASLFPGQPAAYSVETNEHGYRTASFSPTKPAGVYRIVCLGDSVTFGMNVEVANSYPEVLAELLEEAMPGRFEVLNLGVPGFTSRQGLELIRSEVVGYQPDLVTFGFGSNGRFWPGAMSDDANIKFNQSALGGAAIALKKGLDAFYSYRLVRKLVTLALYRFVDRGATDRDVPHRVTLEGIRDAIVAAHGELGRAGAKLLVLNVDIAKTDARQGMKMGVAESHAGFLDLRDLFDQARSERSREIEREQRLPAARVGQTGSLLRVRAPNSPGVSLDWRAFLSPTSSLDPMWDDGSHGDQLAGDGIWSLTIPQPAGQRVLYAYWRTAAGNGDPTREFVPASMLGGEWRMELIPESRVMDIDDFGVYFLHTDNSHPDEPGYRLIAEALLPVVLEFERKSH